MVFYFSLIFSGTNVHKNTCDTIFERDICCLFKDLSGIDVLVNSYISGIMVWNVLELFLNSDSM